VAQKHKSRLDCEWKPKWAKPTVRTVSGPEEQHSSGDAFDRKGDRAVQIPSFANAWMLPDPHRIDNDNHRHSQRRLAINW